MLSKYNWMSLVTGLLLVATAIYMFANPATPLVVLGFVFSISVLLGGVFELVRYFGAPKPARTGWDLINGILTRGGWPDSAVSLGGRTGDLHPNHCGCVADYVGADSYDDCPEHEIPRLRRRTPTAVLCYWFPDPGLARAAVPDVLRYGGSVADRSSAVGSGTCIHG